MLSQKSPIIVLRCTSTKLLLLLMMMISSSPASANETTTVTATQFTLFDDSQIVCSDSLDNVCTAPVDECTPQGNSQPVFVAGNNVEMGPIAVDIGIWTVMGGYTLSFPGATPDCVVTCVGQCSCNVCRTEESVQVASNSNMTANEESTPSPAPDNNKMEAATRMAANATAPTTGPSSKLNTTTAPTTPAVSPSVSPMTTPSSSTRSEQPNAESANVDGTRSPLGSTSRATVAKHYAAIATILLLGQSACLS